MEQDCCQCSWNEDEGEPQEHKWTDDYFQEGSQSIWNRCWTGRGDTRLCVEVNLFLSRSIPAFIQCQKPMATALHPIQVLSHSGGTKSNILRNCTPTTLPIPSISLSAARANPTISIPFLVLLSGLGILTPKWVEELMHWKGLTIVAAEGGVWINEDFFGADQMTLPHEFGHVLGLLHTFSGTEDTGGCHDPCRENYHSLDSTAADLVGDFCRDTPGTPKNFYCAPPPGTDCNGHGWGPTDYSNISKNENKKGWTFHW